MILNKDANIENSKSEGNQKEKMSNMKNQITNVKNIKK